MAKRLSNGRSPLVNPQRQITAFFSKASSSPYSVFSKQTAKSQPNHNPDPKRSPSTSPSPTTPSPLQSKRKKPLLVIGPSPSSPSAPDSATKVYGKEVVNRRIRVYWPLDKSWYEGCVQSFDKISGKHLVQYEDADEELLDLTKEKIEWIAEETKRFRRLRRVSVIEDEEEGAPAANMEEDSCGGDDDSADEDWKKNAEPEASEDASESMGLVDEDDDEAEMGSAKRKRKGTGGGKVSSSKKSKRAVEAKKSTSKVSLNGNGGKVRERNDNGCK